MPRFVLLRHEMPVESERATHWDLMLEAGDVLRTWALDEEPRLGTTVSARQLADHRLAYLNYEGPVSGNRGSVTRVDRGAYEIVVDKSGRVIVQVAGATIRGAMELVKREADDRWEVTLRPPLTPPA